MGNKDMAKIDVAKLIEGVGPLNVTSTEELLEMLSGKSMPSRREELIKEELGKNFIGAESYKEIFGLSVEKAPEIPAKVTLELLNSECELTNDGRKVKETHRLVYVPSKIGDRDFTINSLKDLITEQDKGAVFYEQDKARWYDEEPFANESLTKGKWILMPIVDLPGTRDKTYDRQEPELLKYPEYHTAEALELATGLVMNYLKNNERLFSDFYGFCKTLTSSGLRVFLGDFLAVGLRVHGNDATRRGDNLGRAVLRNLE